MVKPLSGNRRGKPSISKYNIIQNSTTDRCRNTKVDTRTKLLSKAREMDLSIKNNYKKHVCNCKQLSGTNWKKRFGCMPC